MVAMRAWLLLCVTVALLSRRGADSKRFDPSVVDPLMRRSSLDKNFMRFGRSSPASAFVKDEAEDSHESSAVSETSKEDNFLRSMRGKSNNFMRFGRGKSDNFMRFGKGKQDSFIRFGRSRNDNFMRFGRGKQDNFMRFGKGKQDNFMRFGRGKQDSYMRFGRGKQDSFIRFGRDSEDTSLPIVNFENTLLRDSRGKQANFMRFGRYFTEGSSNDIPIVMRADPGRNSMNLMRFGRAKQDGFMRFGKSKDQLDSLQYAENPEKPLDMSSTVNDLPANALNVFSRDRKSKDDIIRLSRKPPSNDDSFIRFGRSFQNQPEQQPLTSMTPHRVRRSAVGFFDDRSNFYPVKFQEDNSDHASASFSSLPEYLEEEYVVSDNSDDYYNRRKRSIVANSSTSPPLSEASGSDDQVSVQLMTGFPAPPQLQSSLLSAGLPNVIVGPEFSLLPDLDPSPNLQKRTQIGDKSFLRLG